MNFRILLSSVFRTARWNEIRGLLGRFAGRTLLGAFVYWLLAFGIQNGHAKDLLIQGATLIDGTGGAPLQDARILIEGNTIRRIWSGQDASQRLPSDTQVLDAKGKFIIPGLIDSHVHFRGYASELFLAHGVTTVYDLGDSIYWQTAVKKGLNSGKIRGPRFYFCASIGIGEGGTGPATVYTRALSSMKTPGEAVQAIAALRGKADCIKLSESVKGDFFTAITRAAHAAGISVIAHSINALDSTTWGIDGIEHMTGVGISAIRSTEGRNAVAGMHIEAGHKNSFLYQWMDPSYFDEMIHNFVEHNVFLNPTLEFEWKGIIDRTPEFEAEDIRLLYDPMLQYIPPDERLVSLTQYHWADKRSSSDREQFLKGYRNVQDFLRRFVKAGGKIYSGTDTFSANTPGLSLHHEMQMYVDAGLTPMQSILTSTKWAAEIIHLDKQLGTIEPNKLADMVILRANPLDNIRNTKAIDQVIRDGEITDISFHGDYQFPFRMYGPDIDHPGSGLYNPAPQLADIKPPVTARGTEARLRLLGQGFVPNSVVLFNGSPVETKWVSATELSAVLRAEQTSQVGTFLIAIESPNPGGGVSHPVAFIVDYP